jgi:ATP-dependent Clp protease adaptor protein ClpS
MGTKEKYQEDLLLLEKEDKENQIVLYNDEVNTFNM